MKCNKYVQDDSSQVDLPVVSENFALSEITFRLLILAVFAKNARDGGVLIPGFWD